MRDFSMETSRANNKSERAAHSVYRMFSLYFV